MTGSDSKVPGSDRKWVPTCIKIVIFNDWIRISESHEWSFKDISICVSFMFEFTNEIIPIYILDDCWVPKVFFFWI